MWLAIQGSQDWLAARGGDMRRIIRLGSGRWSVRIERDARRKEYLRLTHQAQPADSMRVRLPFSWRRLDDASLVERARDPDVRLWTDEHGIQWRIAVVGPGSRHDAPVEGRFLAFDSEETWAGLTSFPGGHLGDLDDRALRQVRDRIEDIGGGRRSFRPPDQALESLVSPD
jgi:hypothetical protein